MAEPGLNAMPRISVPMNVNDLPVFSTAYFAPADAVVRMTLYDHIIIESKEHFIKQSWRNRCHIASANGLQKLIVPLQHNDLSHTPIDEVLISYEENWPKVHLRSFQSAYSNAPFYEYFEHEFLSIFEKKFERLIELNRATLDFLLFSFRKKISITYTDTFRDSYQNDLRNYFHPKRSVDSTLNYHQVFSDKNGFIPNVSALDLLFNCGSLQS